MKSLSRLLLDGGVELGDPGADRLIFHDESAGQLAALELGPGLAINDTVLAVAGADWHEMFSTAFGCVAMSVMPHSISSTSSPATGSTYGQLVALRAGHLVTGLQIWTAVAAAGTDPTGAYVGLAEWAADGTDTVLVKSGNLASDAGWKATAGRKTLEFGSTYEIPADGLYRALLLVNGVWGTTQPTLNRASTAALDLAFTGRQAAQTVLPNVGSDVALAIGAALPLWLGVVGS